jgi:signal peptidase I
MQQEPTISHSNPASAPTSELPAALKDKKSKDGWKGVFSTILILIAAPLVAIFLTSFVFQSYEVDGPSMETTLQNRDRLIVWKVPRSIARLTNNTYVPRHNDIIVFVKHGLSEYSTANDKQLIKRVIGLPGERVVVDGNTITVYNKEHPDGFNPDAGVNHGQLTNPTSGTVDLVVPEGEVFVCGDNRSNSLDSRAFGTIPAKDIVGKLSIRIFPFNKAQKF